MSIREIVNVGSHVEGVNEAIKGWVGTVKAIEGEALGKRFFIEWHSNELDRSNPPQDGQQYSKYPKRAFKLFLSLNTPHGNAGAGVRIRAVQQRERRVPQRFADLDDVVRRPEISDSDLGSIQHPSSSDDDEETGYEEGGDVDESVSGGAAAAAPPDIVQPGRWDQGYLLTLEKKVRGSVVDKVEWRCVNSIPINLHASAYEGTTRLNWNVIGMADSDEKREYDYWALATSDDALREEVVHTNANIAAWNDAQTASGAAHVPCPRCSIGEIIRKKGLRLAMSLQPGHPTAWYWQSESGDCSTLRASCFGTRFGMSRNRFFALEQHEQFCARPADGPSTSCRHRRA